VVWVSRSTFSAYGPRVTDCVTGYTGRNLTKYIHDNNLASEIRIVDKHLPELAWLAPEFKEACSRERFVQADAAQESPYCAYPCVEPRDMEYEIRG
jgi:hypothetical protein